MAQPKVKPIIDATRSNKDVSINTNDLQGDFVDQPGLVAYYGQKLAEANYQESKFKRRLDIVTAKLDADVRQKAADNKEKVTEAMVLHRVKISAAYDKAYSDYIQAQMIAELVKGTMEAMRNRRDMLIQLGATQREELKGAPRINESPGDAARRILAGSK